MDWKTLLAYITGSVDEELLLRNEYLVTENRILRQQIKGRVQLTDAERRSLAEIGQLLEDETARARNRERFRSTSDPDERKAIIRDAFGRIDRQIASLREKIDRLESMVGEAEGRRAHLQAHLEEIESGSAPTPHEHGPRGAGRRSGR